MKSKNPTDHAEAISKCAAVIAKELECDVAGIVTLKGKQICMFMGSVGEGPEKEKVAEAFEVLGNHLLKASQEINEGKLTPKEFKDGFDVSSSMKAFKTEKRFNTDGLSLN